MRRFYLILGVLAVAGMAVLVLASREQPIPGAVDAAMPVVASDGFTGFTIGSDSAPVEVVEYSDFECPFCARFANLQMPAIRRQLIETGLVRWRFRDNPLAIHAYSRLAAHAAHCAGEQGRFWEMHDALFAGHSAWAQTGRNPTRLFNAKAEQAGLEMGPYQACMESNRYAGRIEASRQEGEARGVGGTPTFFVNGARFDGLPTSDRFKAVAESIASLPRP
jgi:protein-disulfide isomerase